MKKRIIPLTVAFCLAMVTSTTTAIAADIPSQKLCDIASVQQIEPRWGNANLAVPSISVSGKQILVTVHISPKKTTTKTTGKLILEKKNGNGWSTVVSWGIDASGTIDVIKNYRGASGVTYRARVIATIGTDKTDCISAECTV